MSPGAGSPGSPETTKPKRDDPLAAPPLPGLASNGPLIETRSKSFGGVEFARNRFACGGISSPGLPAHLLTLHLSGPHPMVHRIDGRAVGGAELRGDAAIVPAGVPFEQELLGDRSEDMSVLLDEGLLRRAAGEAGADPDRFEVQDRFKERDPNLERIMLSFLPELEEGGVGGGLYVQALANALAVHLLREHSSLGDSAARKVAEPPGGGLPDRALRRALDHIHGNLAGDLSLEGIAASANVSPHHFSRLFKRSTGLPPHQYVLRERVELAKRLLLRGELPVAVVAREAGFYDQAHLSRNVKRLLGVTPGRILKESKDVQKGRKTFQ